MRHRTQLREQLTALPSPRAVSSSPFLTPLSRRRCRELFVETWKTNHEQADLLAFKDLERIAVYLGLPPSDDRSSYIRDIALHVSGGDESFARTAVDTKLDAKAHFSALVEDIECAGGLVQAKAPTLNSQCISGCGTASCHPRLKRQSCSKQWASSESA